MDYKDQIQERNTARKESRYFHLISQHAEVDSISIKRKENYRRPQWSLLLSGSQQKLAEGGEESESLQAYLVALQISQNGACGHFCAF